MSNSFFKFKQFTIHQDRCAMKVTTDACLFGAWVGSQIENEKFEIENGLDIGTGTGLLPLMFVQKRKDIVIDAIEIDKEAAEQAQSNIDASPWKNRISVVNEDARSLDGSKKYDLVVSNPPFYENELRSPDGLRNIAHHSDELSLEKVLSIIKSHLNPGGIFFLLLPFKRNKEIKSLLETNTLFIHEMLLVRQSTTHDHFRIMLMGGTKEKVMKNSEISIRNEQQQYTPEFIELLKDYYLYL